MLSLPAKEMPSGMVQNLGVWVSGPNTGALDLSRILQGPVTEHMLLIHMNKHVCVHTSGTVDTLSNTLLSHSNPSSPFHLFSDMTDAKLEMPAL